MAPFKSTGGFSVGKLLGVFRDRDLTLNSSVITNRYTPPPIFKASGGTILTPGNGYKYHFFTNSSSPESFDITEFPDGETTKNIDVLVVAGGGVGGGRLSSRSGGGGGGAGGFVESTSIPLSIGSYTVTVGAGGSAYPSFSDSSAPLSSFTGSNGEYSEIALPTPVRAEGGGGGGGWYVTGNPGGSGGGGGEGPSGPYAAGTGDRVTGTATPATPGQGNPGGFGTTYTAGAGGGGGGAGGAGTPGSSPNVGGPGGVGRVAFSGDSGIPPAYGTSGPTPGRWFAGGGGGMDYDETPLAYSGTGGAGGGGAAGVSGGTNTGGGGGAQNTGPLICSGGPGIVIVRYSA